MPRVVIATEGKPKPDGRVLQPGAVYWEEDRLPVINQDYDLIEVLTDIAREENGDITAQVETPIDLELDEIVLYLDKVQASGLDPLAVSSVSVSRGRLRSIMLKPIPRYEF